METQEIELERGVNFVELLGEEVEIHLDWNPGEKVLMATSIMIHPAKFWKGTDLDILLFALINQEPKSFRLRPIEQPNEQIYRFKVSLGRACESYV